VSINLDPRKEMIPTRQISCVLLHDHLLLRQGLRRLLEDESDIDVVGEAGNAAECLRKVNEHQPDVLVADAETMGLPAPEVERLVTRESPQTKIVFLSSEERSGLAGAHPTSVECCVRKASAEELVEMVRTSCSDLAIGHRSPTGKETSQEQEIPQSASHISALSLFPQPRDLTSREREVLKLLAEGKTVRAAASILSLSSKTVDAHKFNLMRKLGIHNKAELVMWAIQKKVVKLPANF
jgi:two-component system, NarL family, response regulator NreC